MKMNKKKHKLIFCVIVAFCLIATTPIIAGLYLNDLEDVVIVTPPYNNQLLQYNSTSGNWTNINYTAIGDGYAGTQGHPHNQDLNTTDDVIFDNITSNGNLIVENNIFLDTSVGMLFLGENQEAQIGYVGSDLMLGQQLSADMIIDNNGIITTRFQSACRVRLAFNQNVPSGVWTKLLFTIEDYDQNNDYSFGLFLVPVTGLYQISYSILCYDLPDMSRLSSVIWKNGIGAVGGYEIQTVRAGLGGLNAANSGSDILYLNANDFIELYVFHSAGVNRVFPALLYTNYLAICKIA